MTSFFRLLGNLLPSLYLAQQIQNVVLMCLITYSGFIVSYDKMHPWFQWFHWIDPLAYVLFLPLSDFSPKCHCRCFLNYHRYMLKSLLINEVNGQEFNCTFTAPFGPPYSNLTYPYRTCRTLAGSSPNLAINGARYLDEAFNYETSAFPADIIAIFLFWMFFTGLNCIVMEKIEFTGGGYTKHVFKPGSKVQGL